jgi:hypothetical protein
MSSKQPTYPDPNSRLAPPPPPPPLYGENREAYIQRTGITPIGFLVEKNKAVDSQKRKVFTVNEVREVSAFDKLITEIQQHVDYMHKLTNVKWQVSFRRDWPYFWRWKKFWDVTFEFERETEKERQARFNSVTLGVE